MILNISPFALAQEFKRVEFISFTSMVFYGLGAFTAMLTSGWLSVNTSEDEKNRQAPIVFIGLGIFLCLASLVVNFINSGEMRESSRYFFWVILPIAWCLMNMSRLVSVRWKRLIVMYIGIFMYIFALTFDILCDD